MSRREAPAQTVPALTGPASTSQTLDRGLQVLEAVARSGDPLTVAEAAASVGLDRTVAHRLIASLSVRGYLQRDGRGGGRGGLRGPGRDGGTSPHRHLVGAGLPAARR